MKTMIKSIIMDSKSKDNLIIVYFGIAVACIIMASIGASFDNPNSGGYDFGIAFSVSGLALSIFWVVGWLIPNEKFGRYSRIRFSGLNTAAVIIGCFVFVDCLVVSYFQNRNFKAYVHDKELADAKTRIATAKGIAQAKQESIRIIGGEHNSFLRYKKFGDSVLIIDSAEIGSKNMKNICNEILAYYPLTNRETKFKWQESAHHVTTIFKTANGTIKKYTDSLPTSAKEDLCKMELGHFGFVPKPINYAELEGCIRTVTDSAEFFETQREFEKTMNAKVEPVIIRDGRNFKLLSLYMNGVESDTGEYKQIIASNPNL